MNISAVNNYKSQNTNQKMSFKSFVATPEQAISIGRAMSPIPKKLKSIFSASPIKELVESQFAKEPEVIKSFEKMGDKYENCYITNMEIKGLLSDPDNLAENISLLVQRAKILDPLRVARYANDVKREDCSVISIHNLKEEFLGKNSGIFTMAEVCAHPLEIAEQALRIKAHGLGAFMSSVQRLLLEASKNFWKAVITEKQIHEGISEHSNSMYDYLQRIVNKSN